MKTPPFLLIGCPVIIIVAGIVYALTYPSLHRTAFHAALLDAERPASVGDDVNTNVNSDGAAERQQRMERMFDELGLSDAQKRQIIQIRQTVADRAQRREAIMNLLTPEQRTRWEQLRAQRQNGTAPASAVTKDSNGT